MKRLLSYLFVVTLFASSTVFAKTIHLYSEPKTDSKINGTVNIENGVTIVYTPKTGDWIKVANPANGDVGWIKSSDLGGNGYNMRIVSSGNGDNGYSFYQFHAGNGQYSQQLEKEMRQFEQQQRMMQASMLNMFNHLFYFPQPVLVPVVMVPEQPKRQKTTDIKPAQAIHPA
jgi:hypothetical protein